MTPAVDAGDVEERVPLTATTDSSRNAERVAHDGRVTDESSSDTDINKCSVCRICLEEDSLENLDEPCSCSGTMKHTHHECLQRWIQEKGDKFCEICKQPFLGEYEDPPTPGPTQEHITVWGREFLVMTDPETGAIRAHRLQGTEEDDDAQDERMHTGTAWCFTAILLILCLLLVQHLVTLFSMPPSTSEDRQGASGEQMPSSEQTDGAFEDLSVTLLVLWLLMRMLVMVAPVYAVMRVAAGLRGGLRRIGGSSSDRDVQEIELERRLDQLIQRMEAGASTGDTNALAVRSDQRTSGETSDNFVRDR